MKDRVLPALFKDLAEISENLTPAEINRKQRLELTITRRLDNPLISDHDLVMFMMSGCGVGLQEIGKSQAYRDLILVNTVTGKMQLAAKNWYRHLIIEGSKKVYEMAMHNGDAKGAAAALDKLGKYTRCDKDDDKMDWSSLLPPVFEPSDDLTLVEGLEAIPTEKLENDRKRLRALFNEKLKKNAEDAVVIEIADDGTAP